MLRTIILCRVMRVLFVYRFFVQKIGTMYSSIWRRLPFSAETRRYCVKVKKVCVCAIYGDLLKNVVGVTQIRFIWTERQRKSPNRHQSSMTPCWTVHIDDKTLHTHHSIVRVTKDRPCRIFWTRHFPTLVGCWRKSFQTRSQSPAFGLPKSKRASSLM
jgi:hypothetical protein